MPRLVNGAEDEPSGRHMAILRSVVPTLVGIAQDKLDMPPSVLSLLLPRQPYAPHAKEKGEKSEVHREY